MSLPHDHAAVNRPCCICCWHARRAICFLKLSRFQEAKQDCDSALQLEPSNKKAFYRRALAHKGLQVRSVLFWQGFYGLCCHMTPLFVAGLPVSQQRPPGSLAAGPQRAGGRAGTGGGHVFTETEPDGKRRQKNTKGEIFSTSHIKNVIIWCHCVDWGQTHLLMYLCSSVRRNNCTCLD